MIIKYISKLGIFILLMSHGAHAQDERFFRELFSGDLVKKENKVLKGMPKFRHAGDMHKFDLNGDNRLEGIITEKKDGQDYIHIHDWKGERIFSGKLAPMGLSSWLYRISIRKFAKNSKVLILYFYEGETEYLEYRSNVRLYFLTMETNNLESLSLSVGPIIWDEHKDFKDHYHQRRYRIGLHDYNKDGIKEIAVHYHLSSQVYFYKSPGRWIEL